MELLSHNIKKNIVFFSLNSNQKHNGCGFIIKVNERLYCITAGHVVFGKTFNEEPKDLALSNIKGFIFESSTLMTDCDFAKKYDLAIYQIWDDKNNFSDVRVCASIVNSKLNSVSYVKAAELKDSFIIDSIRFSEKTEENEVKYKVYSGLPFNNFSSDEHGAEAMGGISGSPLILDREDGCIVFHGVINRISNQGVNSMPCARGLEPIKLFITDLVFEENIVFDTDFKLITYNQDLLKKEKFQEWIERWRSENENKEYYENLVRKLKAMHGQHYECYLNQELEKILIGDECLKNIIELNSPLWHAYDEIYKTASRECMHEYVSNEKEALDYYKKISGEHFSLLDDDLDNFDLKKTDKKKLAQHDIAMWLAVCCLRFTKI